jgi:hypothetical protein
VDESGVLIDLRCRDFVKPYGSADLAGLGDL